MREIELEQKCIIWRKTAKVELMQRDSWRVNSARTGGVYIVSRSCGMALSNNKTLCENEKKLLTSWLVQERARGNMEPELPDTMRIKEFVKKLQPLTVRQRADNLLKYVDSKISNIGDLFKFSPGTSNSRDHEGEMLAWSESLELSEVEFLFEFLEKKGWLKSSNYDYSLTVDGHSYLSELENKRVVDSSQVFVAMWFDKSMNEAWEAGIEPAIREAGYEPIRIDKKEHLNKIDDEIIAEIRRSKFMVADFTEGDKGARGGVYYEAGFAHGLNTPVIFTCHEDSLKKIHFDTRQYSYIVWEKPEELKSLLAKRISAVLGDGPNRKNRKKSATR